MRNWLCLVISLSQTLPRAKKAMGRARALTGAAQSGTHLLRRVASRECGCLNGSASTVSLVNITAQSRGR